MKNLNTKSIVMIALMSAILCCFGPITIVLPFSPIPISLASLALYLSAYLLGKKQAVISCFIYLLIGVIGIPVFSAFSAGPSKLFGPTGGYLLGYLILTYISGLFIEKNRSHIWIQIFGMTLGTIGCYFIGTLWLCIQSGITPMTAFLVGAVPFLPGDCVKIILTCILGRSLYKRLVIAKIL